MVMMFRGFSLEVEVLESEARRRVSQALLLSVVWYCRRGSEVHHDKEGVY